jgi:hypothetical protein
MRVVFAAGSLDDTMTRVANLATTIVDACGCATVVLADGATVISTAHSDVAVADLELLQRELGEGPSLDALTDGLTGYVADLKEDSRWPRFAPLAAERGLRSVLTLPISSSGVPGAINLYALYPWAFGVSDRARGLLLASLASIAAEAARSHEDEERRADNLHAALVTRELIGQAQGILIERERITGDQAFAILRQASQFLNLKLREVAQRLVDTGERPDTGPLKSL